MGGSTYQAEALKVAQHMLTATLSINRPPMALPTPRGPDSAQGQIQRKSEEGQGLSQYLCGEILNGQGGKINISSHLSLTGRAAGAIDPMGDQGGGIQPKASRKVPPHPALSALLPSQADRGSEVFPYPGGIFPLQVRLMLLPA